MNLENIETTTSLEVEVKNILIKNVEGWETDEWFEGLFTNGCVNGWVNDLVYYSDTTKFFENNKEDINDLLSEQISDCGFSCPTELFGKSFDNEDFLCLETNNQNLLAWFAFEETSRKIANQMGMEF